MKETDYRIVEEKNVIDDHLLDIIGNEFKFDHEKGLAEWLKNSVDAYIRANVPDSKEYVLLRFTDSEKNNAVFECIDFVGMSSVDIDKALKRWGDPEAAKRGVAKRVYGGHGNGGKFYMRQMFKKSYFMTYKNGFLNIFGFNENKRYGFANQFKNKKVNYQEALKMANIEEKYIPPEYLEKIKNNKSGFTLVKGISPNGMKNKIKINKICERLKKHPQSMRIMERINVWVIHNDSLITDNLRSERIKPLKNFEEPLIFRIPSKLTHKQGNEEEVVYLANKKYEAGKLILKTSEIALISNSKYTELNRIDIIGGLGVVASYHLRELGLYFPQTDFIYGECICPILEDVNDDCVMNDRNKLVPENKKTKALIQFIKDKTEELCKKISLKEQKEKEDINKNISSDYNNFLNTWKNRFMSKMFSEVLVGVEDYSNSSNNILNTGDDQGPKKQDNNKQRTQDSKNRDTHGREKTYPRVLLSGYDEDPLNSHNRLFLQSGQGLVYQRPIDVTEGIYWINTTSPLAEVIIEKYSANSSRWRDYLFQRYVDIFIKEALIQLEKREPERFNATTIDGDILGKMVSRIHETAVKDLKPFLFNDRYEINK